jgi:hypothetical protein
VRNAARVSGVAWLGDPMTRREAFSEALPTPPATRWATARDAWTATKWAAAPA